MSRSCTLTLGSTAGSGSLHVGHALPPAATSRCRHLWSSVCPHCSVTGSSSTSQHTAQLQLPWISGSRARLCPALLEAAALPSVFCPPVELVAPLVRAMVACVALLSHCLDGMQRAAAHRRSGKTRVGDGEQSTAVMCVSYTPAVRWVYGMMQALYLAQVCSKRMDTHTYHSVAPASSTASSWFSVRAAARVCSRVCSTGCVSDQLHTPVAPLVWTD